MKSKEEEYRELFLTEALENIDDLNRFFITIEKDHKNKSAINNIFRIIHTLKGNAMGMGYDKIADLSHVMEDLFGAIKEGQLSLDSDLVDSLFRAMDKLGGLVESVTSGKRVSYLGIKTKLEIFLKNNLEDQPEGSSSDVEDSSEEKAPDQEVEEEQQDEVADANVAMEDNIKISVKKMDDLLDMVAELVIEQDRLVSLSEDSNFSSNEFNRVKRIASNLHFGIMKARMVKTGFLFNKFHRVLRDAANSEKKKVELVLEGTDVEIDRNVLKSISDSLIHIVRNSVSHGVEDLQGRTASGKPDLAQVKLTARQDRDNVIISISDDGKGIDAAVIRKKVIEKKMLDSAVAESTPDNEIIRYIFEPGFSSAEKVTELAGRGVGMDVVKKSVEGIGGQVIIRTEVGKGTEIDLLLPSSLAIKGALLFTVSNQSFAVALSYIDTVHHCRKNDFKTLGNSLVFKTEEETIPVAFLSEILSNKQFTKGKSNLYFKDGFQDLAEEQVINLVIVKHSERKLGLIVDDLDRQKEIIEKKLKRPLDAVKILSGTTILEDGTVCPVLDVSFVMQYYRDTTLNSH